MKTQNQHADRRSFLKKAAYVAPVIMALGSLTSASASNAGGNGNGNNPGGNNAGGVGSAGSNNPNNKVLTPSGL